MQNSSIFVDISLDKLRISNHSIKDINYLSDTWIIKFKQNVYKLTDVKKYYILKNIGGGIKNEF